MTQETIVRGRGWGKEWSTPFPAAGMKGMRETCWVTRELASGGRLQNGGAESLRGSGKTWVPIIKMRYEEWCWFYKVVVCLALDVIWLRC